MKILFLIYKVLISNILHSSILLGGCKFYPTCSEYSNLAIEKYGYTRGLFLSIKRILNCSPLSKGGVNLP